MYGEKKTAQAAGSWGFHIITDEWCCKGVRAQDDALLPAFQVGCRGLIHLLEVTDSVEPGNHAVGLFGAFVSRWPVSFIVTCIHLCSLPIIPISEGQRRQKGSVTSMV